MVSATLTAPSTAADRRPFAGREHISLSDLPPLTTTVPRQYVHRTAISEVFLTDWRRAGTDAWVVSAQWPRAHSFYSPVDGLHDPMLLVETMRQASILLSHVAHGVPLDHPIIWQDLHYSLVPEALRVAGTPAEIELHIIDHDLVYRGKRLASARQSYRVLRDGTELAAAELTFPATAPPSTAGCAVNTATCSVPTTASWSRPSRWRRPWWPATAPATWSSPPPHAPTAGSCG